jgi:hypothetical protein
MVHEQPYEWRIPKNPLDTDSDYSSLNLFHKIGQDNFLFPGSIGRYAISSHTHTHTH